METTALPEDIIFIKEMEIVYAKGEKSTIRLRLSIEPDCWEQKDLIPVLDDFNRRFVNEEPKKVELAVKKETKPKPKPTPEKKVVRKDQFAKRWTPEEKKSIVDRYKNGEGPSSIAKDYNVTANTIQQICIRAGAKRGKANKAQVTAKKIETPAEQDEREKKQKQALKDYRERHEEPWYLKG